ncbi:MAG: hypothetical protein A3F70_15875 [Acidobacteria bacterium RIFCSPLOWO2_12_FULL_67_14]|nr:MAG: hypothetical protein A3H29_09405 [Acidobacteria bacterium RIFCSPLOWO2_02_FULL_67_21]OFW34887.1 MAG: hypothetical protein A3F70_15875 [Acidobacteria bacterium RIFCSPLOWO2_12_FULL_67_14]
MGFDAVNPAQEPLPEADAFFKAVRDNLIRAERVNHLYAYRERRTDIHTNPFGRLGTDGTSLFEVYPSVIRSLTYRRLIERNGTPVSARDRAAQDSEYRARVAEVQRDAGGNARRLLDEQDAAARQRGQRAVEDVANTLAFRIDRRDVYDGVPTIVVAFAPKPRASPVTRQGRIAERFAGTIWVAEAAAEVMRLEAKSIDDISIGFGIVARLSEGTTAIVTRRAVDADLWMPVELSLTGRGRAAFFLRRLTVDFRTEWFDYRRLPADVLAPFLDARVQRESGRRP